MKNLIASLLLLTSLSAAIAETKDESLDLEFMEFFAAIYGDPMAEVDAKLDGFASKLKITTAQQVAWNEFKHRFINQLTLKKQRIEEFKAMVSARNGKRFTTPESLELKISILKQQLADSYNAMSTIQKLYTRLDESQRTLFDNGMRHLWFKKQMHKRR